MSPSCRHMTLQDIQQVLTIEAHQNPAPWKQNHFENSLLNAQHECWVLELEKEDKAADKIVGFSILQLIQQEGEILNIAIHPDYRRQVLAIFLLTHLFKQAELKKTSTLFLEVRKSNLPAQTLYHKLGFHQVGLRQNYYPTLSGREDGLVMAREMI